MKVKVRVFGPHEEVKWEGEITGVLMWHKDAPPIHHIRVNGDGSLEVVLLRWDERTYSSDGSLWIGG